MGRGQAKPRVERRRERQQSAGEPEGGGSPWGEGEDEGASDAEAEAFAPAEEWERLVLQEDRAEDARLAAGPPPADGTEDDVFFYDGGTVTSPGSTHRGEGGSAGGGRYTQEWDSKWFENHKPSFYNMKTVVQSDINQTLQDSKEYTQKVQKSTAKYATLKRLSAPRAARSKPGSNPVWGTHKSMKGWISDSRADRTQEARRAALTRREREAQKQELADWKTKRVDRTIKAEADKLMSKQEEHRYSREVHKFLCDDASNKLNDWAEKRKKQLQQAQKLRHTEDWKLTQKGALDRYTGRKKGSQAGGAAATPQDEEVVPLPGEIDVEAADLDASDAAHRAAREAAEAERKPKRRDVTERRSKSSKRSSSTREKSSRGDRESGRERKKDKGKGKRSSKQAAPENADDQPSRRRGAAQHSLKDMRNLEQAKVASDSRRGDSLTACRALFDRIDVDGSGTLEREEIAMLATKMGRGLKSAELDSAMEAMDADGNGSVDFDEFYQCKFACGSSRLAWLWR